MTINNSLKIKARNRLFVAGAVALLLILFFITYKYCLPEIAEYLIVQDELSYVDVIVVISGRGSRYQHAVRLFQDGYSKYILFNYNKQDMFNIVGVRINPEDMIKNLAISSNISLDNIFIDSRCTSTYEDILYARENILKNKFKSAIIVSSNFHMRRVYLTSKKLFKENEVKLVFAPVPMEIDGINPDKWWTREYDIITTFEEYVKLIFYYFKYGI